MTVQADLATAPPRPATPMAKLLAWEADVRRWASVPELLYFVANETRGLIAYDQLFILKPPLSGRGWRIDVVSSIAAVDRNAPVIRAIEGLVRDLDDQPRDLRVPQSEDLADYPYRFWVWRPLLDRDGAAYAALLFVGERAFDRTEVARLGRLGETVSHAWLALTANRPVRRLPRLSLAQRCMLAAAGLAAALFPVRISALAPLEVVAAHPSVITAPFQGVIQSIAVAPNGRVRRGDVLLRFEDVKLRNEFGLAEQRLQVARAKVDQVSTATFADAAQGHGISIAQAEADLAQAEFAYARDLLARAEVRAPSDGLAIYADRRDWEGRSVETGQPIMEVADPAQVRYRIDLPAKEQMKLEPGSPVTVWLDSQPLAARSARLVDASYQARQTPEGVFAFALNAAPRGGAPVRIGSRGTARVEGPWAPLAYALLRRPIASLRQALGV